MASATSPDRAWIPTTATAVVFWVFLLIAAVMPETCPAGSAPPSCRVDARFSAAITGAVLVLAAAAFGVAITYLLPIESRPLVLRIAVIAVALVGVVALVLTLR